jgi:catechol 2,3-dioxygenase-like lactoylglutathione lyase family enzyme
MPAKRSRPGARTQPFFESIAVVVSDARKARDWYTQKLGLDLVDDGDHWITVGRKGQPGKIHLCQPTEGDPKSQLEPGNSGIFIKLPGKDFAGECAKLKARGVEFTVEPTKEPWGEYAVIRDPDGNEHSLGPA